MLDERVPIEPKVDDGFWFSMSENLVTNSLKVHSEAASRLQELVIWLWGIYTTYAAIGSALADKTLSLWGWCAVAAPSAVLIAVYWSTVWIESPVKVEFDPRSPDLIKEAFGEILAVKQRRARWMMAGSVIAALLVTLAVLVLSSVRESKERPSLSAQLSSANAEHGIAVSGSIGSTTKSALIRWRALPADTRFPSMQRMVLPSSSGLIQTILPFESPTNAAVVSLEWTGQDGAHWSISRTVQKEISD